MRRLAAVNRLIRYGVLATVGTVGLLHATPLFVRRVHDMAMGGALVFPFVIGIFIELTLPTKMMNDLGILIGATEVREGFSSLMILHIYLFLFTLFLFFWPGTKGPNKYGFTDNTDAVSRLIKRMRG